MNREEVLEKSRNENKNRDIFEQEVNREAGRTGCIAAAVLCTGLFVFQIFAGRGANYGLYAIVISIFSAQYIVKSVRLKRRTDVWLAIGHTLLTVLLILAFIYETLC